VWVKDYIEPYGNGSRALYYCTFIVAVSMPVPGWIERRLFKSSLNACTEGRRQRVKEVRSP